MIVNQMLINIHSLIVTTGIAMTDENICTSAVWYHGSYYSAEFIFPDFPGQNDSFSLTDLFIVHFSIACNYTTNKASRTN